MSQLARLRLFSERPEFDELPGKCRGRGHRLVGRHVVSGRAYIIDNLRRPLRAIAEGDVVISPLFDATRASSLLPAGGLIIENGGLNDEAADFAFRMQIPLILNVPNVGQFVEGEQLYMLGDGRVISGAP